MRIFITGGTGFIGRHTVRELLRRGHRVLVLSLRKKDAEIFSLAQNPRLAFISGNLAAPRQWIPRVKKFKPEAAIHLAWEGIPKDEAELNMRNAMNGLECIRAMANVGCKTVLVAGSCHEYGEPGMQVNEDSPLRPFNGLYGAKVALYWLGSKLAAERGMKLIWMRFGFVYGPGQRSGSLIPHLIRSIEKGETPILKNPNGGNDFVYVGDVARAIAQITKKRAKLSSGAYNVGSGELTGVWEIVKLTYALRKKIVPREIRRKHGGKISGFWMDISKIRRETRWRPQTKIQDGIRKTLEYLISQ